MENIYEKLINFTKDGIYRYTFAEGMVLYANHGFVDILELRCEPKEVAGKLLKDLMIYIEKEGKIRKLLEKDNEVHGLEYHFKTLSGREKWVICDSFVTTDPATNKKVVEAMIKDITEHKLTENLIRENEQRYKILAEASRDFIFVIDREYRILYVNEAGSVQLGKSKRDVTGRKLEEFFSDDTYQHQVENLTKAFQSGETIAVEHITAFPTSRERWLHTWLIPLKDNNGNVASVIGISRDTTDRKKAEERLQDSERKYRDLIEALPYAVVIIQDRKVAFANTATLKIFGYRSLNDIIGYDPLERVSDRDRERVSLYMKGRLEGKQDIPSHYVAYFNRADGDEFPGEVSVRLIKYLGRTAEQVIVSDVTERRQIEEAIGAEREQLLSIFESIDSPVYVVDPTTYEILYINQVIRDIFGDVTGRKCYEVFQNYGSPCDFCTNKYIFGENIGKPHIWEFQNNINKKWYHCIDKAMRWPDGRMVRCEMAIDVTSSKLAEAAVRTERDKAKMYLDIAETMFIVIGADGRVQLINKKGCDILQCGIDEIIGKNWFDNFIPERMRGDVKNTFRQLMDGHAEFAEYFENSVLLKNGEERIIAWHNAVIKDDQGKPVATLSSGEDITERKQMENIFHSITEGTARVVGEEYFKTLVRHIAGAFGVRYAIVGELMEDKGQIQTLAVWAGDGLADNLIYDLAGSPCENVVGQTICIYPSDIQKLFPNDHLLAQMGAVGYCGTPLISLSDKPLGILVIMDDKPLPEFDENMKTLLYIFATRAAAEIERIGAEKELLRSKERYRGIIESQQDLIVRVKPDGTFTFVNDAYCRKFGKSQEELIGKTFMPLVHEEDLPHTLAEMEKLKVPPYRANVEQRAMTAQGWRWLHWEDYSIRDENDKIVEIQGVGRDINERKVMEEKIKDSERFLSSVFTSIQDGISVLDTDLTIIRVNLAMEKWYSHAMPLVGKKCYEAYHGRKEACEICPSCRTVQTGEAAYEVVPKRGSEGKIVGWLALYSFPLIDAKTGQMNGVIEYVRDITETKVAEKDRDRLNNDLVTTNKKLKQLALKDSQTGCYNHRYLEEVIESEFYRAKRQSTPLSAIMLDIDYFKSINDVYGHSFGDLVLLQLARLLKRAIRRYDILVRFGGEEFVIISPGTERSTALVLTQRILDAITLYNFGNKKNTVKVKMSAAVASYPEDNVLKGIDLIEEADKILDKVKEYGGDKVYSSLDIKKKKKPNIPKIKESEQIKFLKDKIDKLTKRANRSSVEAILALARTMELKDHYTGEHVEKTVEYAARLANAIGLPNEEVERIRKAAILHDLGKVGVSEKILLKRAKLTQKEFDEIKKHPQVGVDIIRPIQLLHSVLPMILYHHERWDGRGYPHGLKGEEIPIGARIIALADVYQALISNRPYRKAYSKKEVFSIIKKSSGTHFDPEIVSTFLKILQQDSK